MERNQNYINQNYCELRNKNSWQIQFPTFKNKNKNLCHLNYRKKLNPCNIKDINIKFTKYFQELYKSDHAIHEKIINSKII